MLETNKATALKFFQALGAGDIATMTALMTDDIVAIMPGTAEVCGTRNREVLIAFAGALPKITKAGVAFEALSMTAEGDRVSCELQGNSVLVNGVAYNNTYHFLVFFRDGRICKLREYLDTKLADEALGPFLKSA